MTTTINPVAFVTSICLACLAVSSQDAEDKLEATKTRIAKMEKLADHALVPPTVNTSPLPEYDLDQLDYGMTIGIARTAGGRLWACWVAGGDSPDAFFVLASSDNDGESWSNPRVVLDSHKQGLGAQRSILVGNLWTDPLGQLWLFFDQSMDMFDGRAGVWATMCKNPDAAKPVWSKPRRIWHGVTLNKPVVLTSGEWMLPISLDQRPGFRNFRGCFRQLDPLRGANVFVSRDSGATWKRRGVRTFPNPDWHEHMIVEKKNGALWMLARTRNGIMESESADAGRTWSEPVASKIKHPVARFHIRRLASDRLLLIKHGATIDSHQGRSLLSAWLSDDEGKSWRGGLMLDERTGVSYPDGFQAPDGTIYISWDRNRATDGEILMARFTETDILARSFKGPKSKTKVLISRPLAREVAQLPAFQGPTPKTRRTIDMPLIDLSQDRKRHSVVAAGTTTEYQGHCDTVLLPDGKTMFTAWCLGHARWIGPIAKSTDAGMTWSKPLDVPNNWKDTSNTPSLHRLVAPDGTARLFCFADGLDWSRQGRPPFPMHQAYSEDNGLTWTPMLANGIQGEVPPKTIHSFDNGKRLVMWSDLPGYVIQSESLDGGLTWSPSRRILRVPQRWSQPCVIRSPDGKTHLMLLRENSRKHQSLYSVSYDNAETWSEPKELPATLTGDRHVAKFAPGGRLVVAFRDVAKTSQTYGHYVAWIGRFDDILAGKPGDYRIKLFHNSMRKDADKPGQGSVDCGYSDLEVLPNGTVVATTYLKYEAGPEKHSVVNTRFTLAETDEMAKSDGRRSSKTNEEDSIMLSGSWLPKDAHQLDFKALRRVPSQHVVISDVRTKKGVNQHNYLAHHDGRFWAMWSDGPGLEDRVGQIVKYASSPDGLQWSNPRQLTPFPPGSGPDSPHYNTRTRAGKRWIARGFWKRNDELLALASLDEAAGFFGPSLELRAFRFNEERDTWEDAGRVFKDAINNFPPKKLRTGVWLMSRRPHNYTETGVHFLAGGVKAIDNWKSYPVLGSAAELKAEEPAWWTLPDQRLCAIFRDNRRSGFIFRAFSSNDGRTWTKPSKTNFPDATSKLRGIRLRDGRYVLVSNSNPKARNPLTLAVSQDGLLFTKLMVLVDAEKLGYRWIDYPDVLEHNDHLYIVFAGNKRSINLIKLSLMDMDAVTMPASLLRNSK